MAGNVVLSSCWDSVDCAFKDFIRLGKESLFTSNQFINNMKQVRIDLGLT